MFKQLAQHILSQIQQAVTSAVNFHAAGNLAQRAYYSLEHLSKPFINITKATYDQSINFEELTEQLTKIATQLDELDEIQAKEWVTSLGNAINDGKNIQYALDSITDVMETGDEETGFFIEGLKKSQKFIKKNDFLQLLFKGFSVWKSTNIIIGLLQEAVNLQKDSNHTQSQDQLICFYIAMACYISLIVTPVLQKILASAEKSHTTLTENLLYLTTETSRQEDFMQNTKKLKQESRSVKVTLKKYDELIQLGAELSADQLDLPVIQEAVGNLLNTVSLLYTVAKLIPNSIDVLRNPIPRETALLVAETLWASVTTCTSKLPDIHTTVHLTRQNKPKQQFTKEKLSKVLKASKYHKVYENIYKSPQHFNLRPHHIGAPNMLNIILEQAVRNKDLVVIEAVINTQGYNPDNKHSLALALINAIQSKDDSLIKIILQHCDAVDVNYHNPKDKDNTPLIIAVINNCSPEIITYIIKEHYADINYANSEGKTALFYAIEQGNKELVSILLENHADVKIIPNNKSSLLDMASRLDNGTKEILEKHEPKLHQRKGSVR